VITAALRIHPAESTIRAGEPAPGRLVWEPVELPDPGPGDAVVRLRFGGICGSDLHYVAEGRVGESVLRRPMILGHEVVGVVETAAADGSGPAAGTPVFVHPAVFCGRCAYCRDGRPQLCRDLRYLGSAARDPHTDGAFAERMPVATSRLLPLGDLDLRTAALVEPATVAWHAVGRAAAVGHPVSGARTAVVGAGPIGLLVVAALRRAGAASIAAIDLAPHALTVAAELGADPTLLAADAAAALADAPPEIVVESSGTAPGIASALRLVADGGLVIAVGQLPPSVDAPLQRVVTRELTIVGSSRFGHEPPDVIAAMQSGSLAVEPVISHVLPVSRAEEAFALAADPRVSSKVLLEFPLG
jgi:L-idonate 5-dehydrogenase